MTITLTDKEYQAQLNLLTDKLEHIRKIASELIIKSLTAFIHNDKNTAQRIMRVEFDVNQFELDIDDLCVKILARRQPVATDLRFIVSAMKQVADIERLSDLSYNICRIIVEFDRERTMSIPDSIVKMLHTIEQMISLENELSKDGMFQKFESLMQLDKKIDVYYIETFREMLNVITRAPEKTFEAMAVLSVIKNIERIGDHLSNLGERDIFRLKGKDVRHRNLKKGLLFDDIRGILFICVHNSARSQIAEAWARALLPEAVKVWSAGSDPSDSVHPDAISVMRDAGINIGHQKPKKISSIPIDEVDVMIVMCGEELCPDLPDIKKRETWILPDPAKYSAGTPETIARMADIRDQIKNRILEFKKDLLKTPPQRDRAD